MVQDAWSTLPKAQRLHISAAIGMRRIWERNQKAEMVLQDKSSCPWPSGASYNHHGLPASTSRFSAARLSGRRLHLLTATPQLFMQQ